MGRITNTEDLIDSRDVIARIEELEGEIEALEDGELTPLGDKEELEELKDLAKEGEDYAGDWQFGAEMIRDSYFREYAQDLAEDCGMVKEGAQWPNNCIDWEQAARELQHDYTLISFGDRDYWIR